MYGIYKIYSTNSTNSLNSVVSSAISKSKTKVSNALVETFKSLYGEVRPNAFLSNRLARQHGEKIQIIRHLDNIMGET